ncbi:MAG: hypothetical protein ACK5C5_04440 [Bacteroidota bacterium]
MNRLNGVFRTFAYHVIIALIYMGAGLMLALNPDPGTMDLSIAGWVIFVYGAYRLFIAIRSRTKAKQ